MFDVLRFLSDHGVAAELQPDPVPQIAAYFGRPPTEATGYYRFPAARVTGKLALDVEHARHAFTWEERRWELTTLSYHEDYRRQRRRYLLAPDEASAHAFFEQVCAHNAEVRDEILVFANACWSKSKTLYRAVRESSLEDLVLPDGYADRIVGDFRRFLDAREEYARYRIPYKRGALFLGPPGKRQDPLHQGAHRRPRAALPLRAELRRASDVDPEQHRAGLRAARGATRPAYSCSRTSTPSSIRRASRSFLNQLDGFASNDGIVTVASTNHPERLDPAILQRPSRFDRKYHFEVPGTRERLRYVARWNDDLAGEMTLPEERLPVVAEATEGFSYAYLKELFVGSLMTWTGDKSRSFDEVVLGEARALSEQMATTKIEAAPAAYVDETPMPF